MSPTRAARRRSRQAARSSFLTATPAEVFEALSRFDPELPWAEAEDLVLPRLPRRRAHLPGAPRPARLRLPPGLDVSFGVDIGPAFISVSQEVLERWGRPLAEVAERALLNVRRRAAVEVPESCESAVADVPCRWYHSRDSLASALLLAPDLLVERLGPGPTLVLAPFRDLLLGMPPDVDREVAEWVLSELCLESPDPLAVPPLLLLPDGSIRLDGPLLREPPTAASVIH